MGSGWDGIGMGWDRDGMDGMDVLKEGRKGGRDGNQGNSVIHTDFYRSVHYPSPLTDKDKCW